MKKSLKISTIPLIALCFVSSITHANTPQYQKEINLINSTQATLVKCFDKDEDVGACYINAQDKYNQIIREVREKNKSKVNSKVWQSINVGFSKQANDCRNDLFYTGKNQEPLFYPYQICLTNTLRSFALTTVELHLKGF